MERQPKERQQRPQHIGGRQRLTPVWGQQLGRQQQEEVLEAAEHRQRSPGAAETAGAAAAAGAVPAHLPEWGSCYARYARGVGRVGGLKEGLCLEYLGSS